MRIIESSNRQTIKELVDRRQEVDPKLTRRVARIVDSVRDSGDKALLRYAKRLDQLDQPVEISHQELQASLRSIAPDLRVALRTSATHIRRIAKRQLPRRWRATVTRGVEIEQRVTPLNRVGCYVPAGRYHYHLRY